MNPKRLLCLAVVALVSTLYACGMANDLYVGGQRQSALCSSMGMALNTTGPVAAGCVKIEGDQIGQAPQTLSLGDGITVTITGWTDKAGEPNEKVGFTFTSNGSVRFAVKAAGRSFVSSGGSWVHPEGTSGPQASAISNITFCPNSSDAGTPGGGSGTDGGAPFDDGSGDECTPGSSDAGTTPPAPGDLTPGSACTAATNCMSGSCVNGVCAPSDENGPCVGSAHCSTDLTCVQGVCKVVIN